MANYYILTVNSLVRTFSILDAGNTISFGLTTQDTNELFENLKIGDMIFGYVGEPIGEIRYVFEVQGIESGNQIELTKCLEVLKGARVEEISLAQELLSDDLVEISEDEFNDIYRMLLRNNRIEDNVAKLPLQIDEHTRVSSGENVLLYGVPGAGKSWTIEHEYCDDEKCMERLVFHPDYMYSDFVGQILPVVKKDAEGTEKVRYEFTPGPFTKILKKAYHNPTKSYFLVIEEINRGNAPAIFGEIFQLLDRMPKDRNIEGEQFFKKCTSEYGITNANIAAEVYGDENVKVRIPANLSIIGTMNTSDQNVFTLDTAFQRRWIMRMIPNSFNNHAFANEKILDTTVSWRQFCEAINEEILRRNNVTSSEDKRLGAYFISADDLVLEVVPEGANQLEKKKIEHHNSRFAEKVLKYLWDDAFKFSHADTFDTKKYKSLEMIVEGFMSTNGDNRFRVYHENLRKLITDGISQDDNMVSGDDTVDQ